MVIRKVGDGGEPSPNTRLIIGRPLHVGDVLFWTVFEELQNTDLAMTSGGDDQLGRVQRLMYTCHRYQIFMSQRVYCLPHNLKGESSIEEETRFPASK